MTVTSLNEVFRERGQIPITCSSASHLLSMRIPSLPDAPCIQIPGDDLFLAELSGFITCAPRADTSHSVRSTLYIWPGLQLYYPLFALPQLLLGLVQVVKQYHPLPLAWMDWWEMVAMWIKPISCLELFSLQVCNPAQTLSFPKVHFLCGIRSPSVSFCHQ